jgi:pyruvate dehydrogenase E1 component beta subunit
MPGYLEAINSLIAAEAAAHPDLLQFGENIDKGSRICGIARSLPGRVLNVGNTENTHVGAGFGLMLDGARSVLFVKQLDFLLLALDPMVNTLGLLRASHDLGRLGSFTIVVIVCDQGWQGPQSSFHDLAGLCSLTRADGYALTNLGQARRVIESQLVRPGFRIIALSQRLFPAPALDLPVLHSWGREAVTQYAAGADATVVCLGFTLPQGVAVADQVPASLFTVQPVLPHDFAPIVESAGRTRRLFVLDDGKGAVSMAHKIATAVLRAQPDCHVSLHTRETGVIDAVSEDRFEPVVEMMC